MLTVLGALLAVLTLTHGTQPSTRSVWWSRPSAGSGESATRTVLGRSPSPCVVTASASASASDQIDSCFAACRHAASADPCEVHVSAGRHVLTKSIRPPPNSRIGPVPGGDRDSVVMARSADVVMGPLVVMTDTNDVVVHDLTLDGMLLPPNRGRSWSGHPAYPWSLTNVYISNCSACTVAAVVSTGARLSSINVAGGANVSIVGCHVHSNGAPEDSPSEPFLRSDGITVQALTGTANRVVGNHMLDNTDLNLVVGGGTDGRILVSNNTVHKATLRAALVSGGAFGFDTERGWSALCHPPRSRDCGDFSALEFVGNIDQCGVDGCMYGTFFGTHLNSNWGRGGYSPGGSLPVHNLHVDLGLNTLPRVTIDFTASSSKVSTGGVQPLFCRASTLSSMESLPLGCGRCEGLWYRQTNQTNVPWNGSNCDPVFDAGRTQFCMNCTAAAAGARRREFGGAYLMASAR